MSAALLTAQTKIPKKPTPVPQGFLQQSGAILQFNSSNKMTAAGNAAVHQQHVVSVPYWMGSFTYQGTAYPYSMVGRNPKFGGTTEIDTSLIAISLVFPDYQDQNGNEITLDVTPLVKKIANSPNFEPASYDAGYTQFADAVQRAEFYGVMGHDWHTLLERPRMLTPVTVEVPGADADLFITPDGTIFAVIDEDFFLSQLNTIIQLEGLRVSEIPLAVTYNAFLAPNLDLSHCCVGGFHTALETNTVGNTHFLQTFAWASWEDAGILANGAADVTGISHELGETIDDPFVNNVTPPWQNPNGSGACGGNVLEIGDPIEVLPNAAYPVTVHGYLYHPQNDALLQWFSRESPSSALDHAYSYPNTTLLTAPSTGCQ